ncbi:MAG: hypothetical protein HZB37_02240 [Planctomycetes bacterium]|nr:hypothetical protein [Planctomycetota bacterium]
MNKGIIGVISVIAFALFGCAIAFSDVPGEAKKETASTSPAAENKPVSEGVAAPAQAASVPPVEAQKPAPVVDKAPMQEKGASVAGEKKSEDGSITVSSQPQVEERKPVVEEKKPTAEKKKPAVKKDEMAFHPKDKRTIQQIISERPG